MLKRRTVDTDDVMDVAAAVNTYRHMDVVSEQALAVRDVLMDCKASVSGLCEHPDRLWTSEAAAVHHDLSMVVDNLQELTQVLDSYASQLGVSQTSAGMLWRSSQELVQGLTRLVLASAVLFTAKVQVVLESRLKADPFRSRFIDANVYVSSVADESELDCASGALRRVGYWLDMLADHPRRISTEELVSDGGSCFWDGVRRAEGWAGEQLSSKDLLALGACVVAEAFRARRWNGQKRSDVSAFVSQIAREVIGGDAEDQVLVVGPSSAIAAVMFALGDGLAGSSSRGISAADMFMATITDPDFSEWTTRVCAALDGSASTAVGWAGTVPDVRTDPMDQLESMVGLTSVKALVSDMVALARMDGIRAGRGLPVGASTRHLVFTGNPGTGKTTVARLIGEAYRRAGVLSKGHVVEVDRASVVGKYVGHTAAQLTDLFDAAAGGVLFIDEAYALAGTEHGPDSFGQEAIDVLNKALEDRREDLVVIVAGYPNKMTRFLDCNPGLASRLGTVVQFDDYSNSELADIVMVLAAERGLMLTAEAAGLLPVFFGSTVRDDTFGNGRLSRNLLDASVIAHAVRLKDSEEPSFQDLVTVTADDVAGGIARIRPTTLTTSGFGFLSAAVR